MIRLKTINDISRLVGLCLVVCLIMVLIMNLYTLENPSCNYRYSDISLPKGSLTQMIANPIPKKSENAEHFLCILIPFRDRFEELNEFVPTISEFLKRQNIYHAIFVINQVDTLRFNRASLINVGFVKSAEVLKRLGSPNCDYVALHDVDLVPLNPNLSYGFPDKGPFHVAAPGLHPKYDYPDFLGGILLISRDHFNLANGMSNRYWGWGLEDDEFHRRLVEAGLQVQRPKNITTGKESTFKHFHSARIRKRDMTNCYNQYEVTRKRDRETGLNSLAFTTGRNYQNCADNVPYTLLNIVLQCDRQKTPWCDPNCPPVSKPKNLERDSEVIVPIIKKKKKIRQKRSSSG